MIGRFPIYHHGRALVAVALISLAGADLYSLQAADTKEKRRIFDWNADPGGVDTNVTASLPSRRLDLRELESSLSDPFRELNSGNSGSLDGRFAPKFRPAPPTNPNLKKEQNRRKNWGIDESELEGIQDPFSKPWESDWSKALKEGRSDPLNPLTPRQNQNNPNSVAETLQRNPFGPKEDKLPGALREQSGTLKKLMEDDSLSFVAPKTSFADFFGLGDTMTSERRDLSRKAYLNEYKQIIGGGGTAVPASPATDLFGNSSSSVSAQSPVLTPPTSMPKDRAGFPEPQLGMINPRFTPEAVPDLNSRVLNSWNPMHTLLQPTAPKVVTKPKEFSVPKRAF